MAGSDRRSASGMNMNPIVVPLAVLGVITLVALLVPLVRGGESGRQDGAFAAQVGLPQDQDLGELGRFREVAEAATAAVVRIESESSAPAEPPTIMADNKPVAPRSAPSEVQGQVQNASTTAPATSPLPATKPPVPEPEVAVQKT